MTPTPTPQRPDARADLHAAVCNAVALMNVSPEIARSEDGRKAHTILRQALMDYTELPAAPAVAPASAVGDFDTWWADRSADHAGSKYVKGLAEDAWNAALAAQSASAVDQRVNLSIAFLDGYLPEATENKYVIEHWCRIKAALAAPSDAQPTIDSDATYTKSIDAQPAQAVTDHALRELWLNYGGEFYGPNVETGKMEESKLLPFLRMLILRVERARSAQEGGTK